MGITWQEMREAAPYDSDEVFMLVYDALCPAQLGGSKVFRENLRLGEYDAVVDGLCRALVVFGGLDIDDLVDRLRATSKAADETMSFPYNYEFRFIAK